MITTVDEIVNKIVNKKLNAAQTREAILEYSFNTDPVFKRFKANNGITLTKEAQRKALAEGKRIYGTTHQPGLKITARPK